MLIIFSISLKYRVIQAKGDKNFMEKPIPKFINATQAGERYQMNYRTLRKNAVSAGAWSKLSDRTIRIDVEKFDAYLNSKSAEYVDKFNVSIPGDLFVAIKEAAEKSNITVEGFVHGAILSLLQKTTV